MKKILLTGLLLFTALYLSAQGTISFARWKNDAKAAYSFDSDDFGQTFYGSIPLIASVLDTMPAGTKMTFATNGGLATASFWDSANTTLLGNDFVNHSFDHSPYGTETYYKEYDSNQKIIDANIPWQKCLVFVYPGGGNYVTATFNDYIKSRKAIGTLNYNANGGPTVAYNLTNPLGIGMDYYYETTLTQMNQMVDDAVAIGGWSLRASHQIGIIGGWGPMSADMFKQHMGYCKKKILSNDIWMSGATNIIKYLKERSDFSIQIITENDTMMVAKFITDTKKLNPSAFVDNTVYDEPLTLKGTTKFGTVFKFDANPWGGNVVIKYDNSSIKSVKQMKYTLFPVPVLTINKKTASVIADPTGFDIQISATPKAYITSSLPWIVPGKDSIAGSGTVTITVNKNIDNKIRWGYITISNGTVSKIITIKQAASGKWLSFTQDSVKVLYSATSAGISVNTNVSWTLSTNASWVTLPVTTGTNYKSVSLTLTQNPDTTVRIAWVKVFNADYADSIKIIQGAKPIDKPILAIDDAIVSINVYPNPVKNNLTISSAGNIKSIKLISVEGIVLNEISCNKNEASIDLSSLAQGCFNVRIYMESGQVVNKIIIKD